ncbi:Dapper-like protein 1 Frodo 1 [Larimichthys crocea]|uniref:Dapper-like protein 1 Frodo 1 n=1 Tax=Larimichthys crocea TaxID=215358 RepID=A0A6G0IFV0_LARCR|nr:Dapper-like protein 1 Frodo 1 [Larimichthys crocea]
MPLSAASRRDTDGCCSRDRAASDPEAAERLRSVRERLEATVSGLAELDYLRERQEVLVRAALQEEERRTEAQLSSEEKLLEENILLLRKQLNCLRRRDASLIGQLQELDRQISDLRLDTEVSHDQLETDSRPSSGFYELSDSPSLSNSSNSVFSDNDGRLPSADELASCLDCDGLYHCDLVAQNGSNVYLYPSPLHAVAVQSPAFLQMLGHRGHCKDEARVDGLRQEPSPPSGSVSAPLIPQSSSWSVPSSSSQTPSQRHLDSYIYSLLQRRAQPIRTSRPRTSISTDPSKSILRQAGLCARQVSGSGLGTLRGSELKPSWPAGGASAEGAVSSSPQRRRSVDRKSEEQETPSSLNTDPSSAGTNTSRLPPSTDLTSYSPDQELLTSPPAVKTPKNNLKPQTDQTDKEVFNLGSSSQSQDEAGRGGGGGSHMVNLPAQQQDVKLRKNVKTVKVKTTTIMSQGSEQSTSERRGARSHHRSSSKKSWLLEDGGPVQIKVSKRTAGGGGVHMGSSSRIKRFPASIPKGRVLDKHTASTTRSVRSGASRYHHHGNHNSGSQHHHSHHQHLGRDQVVVVAKPKYKRSDYQRLRAIMEIPYDEAFRRSRQRQRKELLSHRPMSSPYSYTAGSDSEYSAECVSLFHSTIMDTSEDDRSNYTTNCFGDSESGEEEYVEESAATSDTEESGGGGAGTGGTGRGRSQLGSRVTGQEVTPAQVKTFVKIKASHNLKRKILRFRSGSLKLMTTV